MDRFKMSGVSADATTTMLIGVMAFAFAPTSVMSFGLKSYSKPLLPLKQPILGRRSQQLHTEQHQLQQKQRRTHRRFGLYYRSPFPEGMDFPPPEHENQFFYDFDFFESDADNLDYMAQEDMMFPPPYPPPPPPHPAMGDLYGVNAGRGRGVGVRTFDGPPPPPSHEQDVPHPFRTASRSPATYSITRPDTATPSSVVSTKSSDENNDADGTKSNKIESIRDREPAVKSIWDTTAPEVMDGNTMETWAFPTPDLERVQVLLKSSQPGTPLQATIDLWHGPENTPCKMAVYCLNEGDCSGHQPATFSAILETPRGQNTVAVKNIADMDEAPMMACVEAEMASGAIRSKKKDFQHDSSYHNNKGVRSRSSSGKNDAKPLKELTQRLVESTSFVDIKSESATGDGRNVHTVSIPHDVASMQVMLSTEALRPLQARIEVAVVGRDQRNGEFSTSSSTTSPSSSMSSSIQQICEVHSEDGDSRPLFAVLDIPPMTDSTGKPAMVELRIVNLSSMDFPLKALVKPYAMREAGTYDQTEQSSDETTTGSKSGKNTESGAILDAEIVQ